MPLLTNNLSFGTCGGPEVFTSTTIFKKCGGKASSGGQECYVEKTHLLIEMFGDVGSMFCLYHGILIK